MRTLGYFVADDTVSCDAALSRTFQERAFAQYCQRQHHNLIATFVDAIHDESKPEYQRMIEYIEQSGKGFLLVITDPTHLGKELESGVGRLLELDTLHSQVVCIDERLPDPLQGLLHTWTVSSPKAIRRERIRQGMRAKAVNGEVLGKPPFGYRVGSNGKLEQIPHEAEVVRLIYNLYLRDDVGIRTIARHLNDRGYTTRRGQGWSMVTIRDILRNHTYIGTYARFGLRIPSSHPRMISPEEFRGVQDRMKARSPVRRQGRAKPFLLSGLVYCDECGNRMIGITRRQVWRHKNGERVRAEYRYYQCQSRTNRSQCQYHTWRAATLECRVLDYLNEHVPGNSTTIKPIGQTHTNHADLAKEEGRLRSLWRRYVGHVQRAAAGAISLSQLRAVIAEIEVERTDAHNRLAVLKTDADGTAEVRRELRRRFLEEWEQLHVGQQQEVLRSLVEKVTVDDSEVEILQTT